jgi:hypothetical protein
MVGSCGDWSSLDLVLLESIKARVLEVEFLSTNPYRSHAHNGSVRQVA